MRPVSKKRQKLMREVKPIRDGLRNEVGRCEICGSTKGPLDVHEISRGVHRVAALDKPFALLLVCRKCHDELGSAAAWPEPKQLACLAKSRPLTFNLQSYLELTSPKAMQRITIDEVLAFMKEDYLSKQDIAERLQVDRRSVQNYITSGELPAIDCRTAGATRPLYRIAWEDFLAFCRTRKVSVDS